MPTTPIYGWPWPAGTDRVMDGDNAMGSLANAIETSVAGPHGVIVYGNVVAAPGDTFAIGIQNIVTGSAALVGSGNWLTPDGAGIWRVDVNLVVANPPAAQWSVELAKDDGSVVHLQIGGGAKAAAGGSNVLIAGSIHVATSGAYSMNFRWRGVSPPTSVQVWQATMVKIATSLT